MKNERLLESIGEISEHYIAEASPTASAQRKRFWIKWGAFAAFLAFAAFTAVKMVPAAPVKPGPEPGELPMLTLTENSGESMGFEGYMAYDISEIVSNNPWAETAKISTLPVYKSQLTYDKNYQILNPDFDQMKALLLDVADRLGMDANKLEITGDTPGVPGEFTQSALIAQDNGIKITVDPRLTAEISFNPAISLPDKYTFTHYASYKQFAGAAKYLQRQYKDFIGMKHPKLNIYGGDYSIFSGDDIKIRGTQHAQNYHIEFYDGSGDKTSQIINYNFNRVAFYCNDQGRLFLARVFQPDLSGKVGDYPIITVDAAKELLKNGSYITTVPAALPGLESVAKVELVYRIGQYFMPYYRFYVELPDLEGHTRQEELGLKTYGAYYVPAVEGAYISNMPVWDGGFN